MWASGLTGYLLFLQFPPMPLYVPRRNNTDVMLPEQIYVPRVAGLGLGGIGLVVAVSEGQPVWFVWILLIFVSLVWPHLAYLHSSRSVHPDRAEKQNLLVDSMLLSMCVYAIGGNLMPSAIAVTIMSMNNMSVGGPRLWLQGVLAGAFGATLAWLVFPWNFMPESSLRVQIACLPMMALYFPAFGWTTLQFARGLRRTSEALGRMSREDALSEVAHRRSFGDELERVFGELRNSNGAVVPKAALLLFDIDHFKRINDAGGHAAGDAVIRRMGATLKANVPRHDLAARYGGDEFVVMLNGAGPAEAIAFVERLQADLKHCHEVREPHLAAPRGPAISISTGIACYHDGLASPDEWVACADAALYTVKRRARGGIEVFDGTSAFSDAIRMQVPA